MLEPSRTSALRLHHIGFVVDSIPKSIDSFLRMFQAAWDEKIFDDPIQKAKVTFLTTRAGDGQIELVEPLEAGSPVSLFLEQKGGGLHHLCYEVARLDEELKELRSRGIAIAKRPQPAVAFGGRRIAWVITRDRLLVELLEAPVETM